MSVEYNILTNTSGAEGIPPHHCFYLSNGVARTNLHTSATVGTDITVDNRQVVFHSDGVGRTVLHTKPTGDTTPFTNFPDLFSFVLGLAMHIVVCLAVNQVNNLTRAGILALSTADTDVLVNDGQPFFTHGDSVNRAYTGTSPLAHTTETTGAGTATKH